MTRIACAAAIAACLVACDGRAHIDTSRTDGGSDAGYPRLLFADIQYGTSCVESPGCTPAPLRDICGIHRGDVCPSVGGAARVGCDIVEVTGSDRTVTFSADQGGDFSISVSQAVFGFRGGGASHTDPNSNRGRSRGRTRICYAAPCSDGPPQPS